MIRQIQFISVCWRTFKARKFHFAYQWIEELVGWIIGRLTIEMAYTMLRQTFQNRLETILPQAIFTEMNSSIGHHQSDAKCRKITVKRLSRSLRISVEMFTERTIHE